MRGYLLVFACVLLVAAAKPAGAGRPVVFPALVSAPWSQPGAAEVYLFRQTERANHSADSGPSLTASPGRGLFSSELDAGTALRQRVQALAHQLLTEAGEDLEGQHVVAVATFVNLSNLYKTSSLGRYLSEQLISALQAAGLEVIELRKTPSVLVSRGNGEYGLSRDMAQLDFVHPVSALVAGTYTWANGELFINARVLRNSDGMVLGTADLVFPLDALTREMLADERAPARPAIPVRVRELAGP